MSRVEEFIESSIAGSPTLEDIALEVGTPFFVYDKTAAIHAYRTFESALKQWGPARVAYSVKTNPLAQLLVDLRTAGAWAEVTSPWEFEQSMAAGFQPAEIIFNGPLKAAGIPVAALDCASIQIDSLDELVLVKHVAASNKRTVAVGLPICPPQFAGSWSRFGLSVEGGELDEALSILRSTPDLELRSCHFHMRTQVDSIDEYVEMALQVKELCSTHEMLRNTWLDIGGGFPYDHGTEQAHQPFEPGELVKALIDAWGNDPRPVLIVEPGRWIAAPCLTAVGRAISRKRRPGEPTIVVLDIGTNQNVMAAFFEHTWSFIGEVEDIGPFRLCGPLCMEDDILSGATEGLAPALGSLVIAGNSGAYSIALARNFIQRIAPVITIENGLARNLVERGGLPKSTHPEQL